MNTGSSDPFEAVRAMMHDTLDRMGDGTQGYLDMLEKIIRAFPGANQEQIASLKAYIGQRAAANREFAQKLLNAKDLAEGYRIQVEYFESQLTACAENATQVGASLAASFRTFMPLSNYLAARIEPTEIIARMP